MLAVLALAACASVPAIRRTELYRAQGDGWRLRIFNNGVNLDRRLGQTHSDGWGELPVAQAGDDVVRFEGRVTWIDVVAREAVDEALPYKLEIRAEPCRDRRGRMHPTSVRIDYGQPDTVDTGCGGPLPPSWPPLASG